MGALWVFCPIGLFFFCSVIPFWLAPWGGGTLRCVGGWARGLKQKPGTHTDTHIPQAVAKELFPLSVLPPLLLPTLHRVAIQPYYVPYYHTMSILLYYTAPYYHTTPCYRIDMLCTGGLLQCRAALLPAGRPAGRPHRGA